MGAVVLPLMALYLGLLIWASWYGWRWAKRRNYSTGKRALYAFGGFLIVYLPLMWDWIPTELAHRYYCKKEAGLWIYKTLDQWKAENPGVFETLVYNKDRPFKWVYREKDRSKSVNFLNERINYTTEGGRVLSLLPLRKEILEVIDAKKDEVIARYVDFGYGGPPAFGVIPKIWMGRSFCRETKHLEKPFFDFENSFKGAEICQIEAIEVVAKASGNAKTGPNLTPCGL